MLSVDGHSVASRDAIVNLVWHITIFSPFYNRAETRMAEAPNVVFHAYADSGVLITGGTSGVGLASAIQFAHAGVR